MSLTASGLRASGLTASGLRSEAGLYVPGGSIYDPLALSPALALDANLTGGYPLNLSAANAGYLDKIATWPNPGTGSDATQTTDANRPVWLWDSSFTGTYLHCPGITGNGASVPDEAALDITGDVSIEIHLNAENNARQLLVDKGFNKNYYLRIKSSGRLRFYRAGAIVDSEVLPALGFNSKHLSVRHRVSDNRVGFFESDDGVSWTQIGSYQTAGANTPISSTNNVTIGTDVGGADIIFGAIHRVQIFASVDGTDKRLDIDFADATHGATSFACSTGQTVTLSQSGNNPAAFIGKERGRSDGTNDYLELSTPIPLNAVPHVTLCWHGMLNRVSGSNVLIFCKNGFDGSTRALTRVNAGVITAGGRRLDSDAFADVAGGAVAQYESCTIVAVIDYANAAVTIYKNGSQVATGAFQTAGNTSATDSLGTLVASADASQFAAADQGQAYIYPVAMTAAQALGWHNYATAK